MSTNAERNRISHKVMSATVVTQTLKFTTNTSITPFTPVTGVHGSPFINAVTGQPYYEYFIPPTSNPLPAGLSINLKTGSISGTPTASTIIDKDNISIVVTIAVRDSINKVAFKKGKITFVIADPLVVENKTLTYNGKVNFLELSDSLFTVTGGVLPYKYTITQGELPPNVTIDQATGVISGKPSDLKRTYTDPSQIQEIEVTPSIVVSVTDAYDTIVESVTTVNFNIEDVVIAVPSPKVTIQGPVPLNVHFEGFSSVTLGTQPYVYFTPASQKNLMPEGVTLNPVTGVISGAFLGALTTTTDGVTSTTYDNEYKGTLQISVRDQDGYVASKVAKVDINAYLPFAATAKEFDNSGQPILSFNWPALKPIHHTPLKGINGLSPYTFELSFCSYFDKLEQLTQYDTTIPGVTINASDGRLSATNGLPAGLYLIDFKITDAAGTVLLTQLPRIIYTVSDGVIAIPVADTTEYNLYVNESSNLDTGYNVLRAELGTPPYTFDVTPKLPDGLEFLTTETTCRISGTPTKSGKRICEFSVKDSTGVIANTKYTITFNIADLLTTSSDDIEIVQVLGDPAGTVQIFKTITGGFPPYSCTKMFGQVPPEYNLKGEPFTYLTSSNSTVQVDIPKLWGNDWLEVPGGIKASETKNFSYLGTYTSYYAVSDSRGSVSGNRSRVSFTICEPLEGFANIGYTITGFAGINELEFKPIFARGGVPPYRIKILTSVIDPETKNAINCPDLGLTTYQPDTIAGIPKTAYTGKMYFYLMDKLKRKTPNISVNVDILARLKAVPLVPPRIMCVQGIELYEIAHTVNGARVTETVTSISESLFESVTGGKLPYVYYVSNFKGEVISPSPLPKSFSINSATGILTGSATKTVPTEYKGYFCTVADANNDKSEQAIVGITINAPLASETVNNVVESFSFLNADGTRSNTRLVKVVGSMMMPFKISKAKYGSGRYEFSIRILKGESDFNSTFTINSSTGEISLINPAMLFTTAINTKISVNIKDTFTNVVLESPDILEITVYPAIRAVTNPDLLPEIKLYRGRIVTDLNIVPVLITGGSGEYIVDTIPPLPTGLLIDNKGMLVDAPKQMSSRTSYLVQVNDAIFPGVHAAALFEMVVQTVELTVDVPEATARTLTQDVIMASTNMTLPDLMSIPMVITLNVTGTQSGSSDTIPGLKIYMPDIHPLTTVTIDITGGIGIVGCGGSGGSHSSDASTRNGKQGGPGLIANVGQGILKIKTNGKIIAGGGGGGGAGGNDWRSMTQGTATRYLSSLTTEYPSGKQTRSFIIDTVHVAGSSANIKVGTIDISGSYPNMTKVYNYIVSLDKLKMQTPGKPSAPTLVGGAGGGRGAGGAPGGKGGKSPSGPSTKVNSGAPDEKAFLKAGYAETMTVATMPCSGDMSYGSRSPASAGQGMSAGEAGEDLYGDNGSLYGCAGGGGGGYGGIGGDGGVSSQPPNKAKLIPGGKGGKPGIAMDVTMCVVPPIILPGSVIIGDVLAYIEPVDTP